MPNYTFPSYYVPYSTYVLRIYDKILDTIRGDSEVANYQFKTIELVGNDYVPELSGMPAIRIIPEPDNISQNETDTRDHHVGVSVFVFDHRPNLGEVTYREHVKVAGRLYDLMMNNRRLDDLVQDSYVEQVTTRFLFNQEAGGGMSLVSVFRMDIYDVKEEVGV